MNGFIYVRVALGGQLLESASQHPVQAPALSQQPVQAPASYAGADPSSQWWWQLEESKPTGHVKDQSRRESSKHSSKSEAWIEILSAGQGQKQVWKPEAQIEARKVCLGR